MDAKHKALKANVRIQKQEFLERAQLKEKNRQEAERQRKAEARPEERHQEIVALLTEIKDLLWKVLSRK